MTAYAAASAYRESEVLSASPARLLSITFDYAVTQMMRAKVGIESGRSDVVLAALDKARQAVGELLASVDPKQGGELAHRLVSVYVFVLAELVEVGRTRDATRLERNTQLIRELRDAFASAAAQTHREVA